MTIPSPEQFSLGEITEVLEEVLADSVEAEMILHGLQVIAQARRESNEIQGRKRLIKDIVEDWQRTNGSTSGIEGAYSYLEASCRQLVYSMRDVVNPIGLEKTALETAATTFIYLRSETDDELDDEELAVLDATGVDKQEILDRFKTGIKTALKIEEGSPGDQEIQAVEDISELIEIVNFHPDQWSLIVETRMQELKAACEATGIELRQLNEEGKYDEEDD